MTEQDSGDRASDTPGELAVVRIEDLGRLIWTKRKTEGLTLGQVARQTGLSAATLSRLERRRSVPQSEGRASAPDTRTLAALTRWIGVSIDRMMEQRVEVADDGVEVNSIPDIVEAHLRADRHLDAKTAGALGRMFRAAYEQFADVDATTHD